MSIYLTIDCLGFQLVKLWTHESFPFPVSRLRFTSSAPFPSLFFLLPLFNAAGKNNADLEKKVKRNGNSHLANNIRAGSNNGRYDEDNDNGVLALLSQKGTRHHADLRQQHHKQRQ